MLRIAVVVVSGMFATAVIAGCAGGGDGPTVMVVPAESATATATVAPTAVVEPTSPVTPTSTATAAVSATPTSTVVPTVTPTVMPRLSATSTATEEPTGTPSPAPSVYPLAGVRFVENDDCVEGISRELLPTIPLVIEDGDASHLVVAEVADDASERQQGLMCRETVPEGSGMLFVYEDPRSLGFWMFNTYVPLDIVYLDDEKGFVRGLRMEPCPRPEGAELDAWRTGCSAVAGSYNSGGLAKYALELPAGWLASVGLELENLEGVKFSW